MASPERAFGGQTAAKPDFVLMLMATLLALPWLNPFAPPPSAYAVPWLVALGSMAALLAVCAVWQPGWSDFFRACLIGWLAAALLNSLIGLAQYTGLSTQLQAPWTQWINQTHAGMAYGHLRQRNQLATLCSMGLICLFCLWHQRGKDWPLWLALTAGGLLCAASAATHSRIGLLELLLVLIGIGLIGWRTSRRELTWAALCFFAVYALCSHWLPRIGLSLNDVDPALFPSWGAFTRFSGDSGCEQRSVLWANVVQLISVHPWTGWGWGELDYAHYIHAYQLKPGEHRFCDILDNAHNLPLQLAVELGIPLCAAGFAGFILWAWRSTPWRETSAQRLSAWAVLAVIGLHSLVEYPLWYGSFFTAAAICLIFLACRQRQLGRLFLVLPALSIAAFTAYASFDYHRVSQVFKPGAERSAWYADDPLGHANHSLLFKGQVEFARLSLMQVTPENAPQALALSQQVLHHSPESGVIEKLLQAAQLTGRQDLYALHQKQYRAAFPAKFELWRRKQSADEAPQ